MYHSRVFLSREILRKEWSEVDSVREIETDVIRMGDVAVVIDLVDRSFSEGREEQTERAIVILKEIFEARYKSLRQRLYGGERNG